ncbi:Dot/Icm T4SS effector VpdC [Legionella israelensis]|uniref:Esterase of the alpha-beta hydrolase superfamily protein n=1 Tax=Legionella israelensis TaxID=454 RepID=A0A0W0VRI5_9GAMM|nr:Dot/Icm T4SS effector VpdC [Legionella israelensis]KTD22705.1 esterase of the alpha-beta hydrolase superfamily protein [Legionella israelensis]QBS08494.1 phospholipase [Legionella israelensis]SCY44146.1 NTE family protein [Legionella israelensis DSM 19235]STX58142.1 esterase of the alpha-beta hydrolase superfamily [Legionella israelensis]
MAPQDLLCQLLESDGKYADNIYLLKKIILTAYLGRLRINSLSPDRKYTLANYLLDDENIIFDFTRLSEEKKEKFLQWLLKSHEEEKETVFLNRYAVNEYRGYSAEVSLNWWGKFKSWLFNKRFDHWTLADISLSLHYQLTGLNVCYGKKGLLIGLNQFLSPPMKGKYSDPEKNEQDSNGNAKRVYITDKLVDRLLSSNIGDFDFNNICKKPHPHSLTIDKEQYQSRYEQMHAYRTAEKFHALKPWYIRLFGWVASWFKFGSSKKEAPSKTKRFEKLLKEEQISISRNKETNEILVLEKRPDSEIMVFCGGGPKIFAHVGVYKAFCDAGLRPKKYAGSSAGAIMSVLCYLGCTPEEIFEFFKSIRPENLIYYEKLNVNGISNTNGLKAALDYMINKKILEVLKKHHDKPEDHYPKGKITFGVLEHFRKQYPDCGFGEELTVTATRKLAGETTYFSFKHSPDEEVSKAVTASACLPIVFQPVKINDEEFNDGGIKSNFPTEIYKDDYSSLLESEHGNNLKLVGIQFNNGTERHTLDRIKDKVYRENFLLNWIYRLLTGVNDPASGWEQDRIKLRQHALQTIVLDIGKDVNISSIYLSEESKIKLLETGLKGGKEYIDLRYRKTSSGKYKNQELMYSTFANLFDLLVYCCYRENLDWFERVYQLILQSKSADRSELIEHADQLRKLYFPTEFENKSKHPSFYNHPYKRPSKEEVFKKAEVFVLVYPVFKDLSQDWLMDKTDKFIFEKSRFSLSLNSPFECLEHLEKIKGKVHIIFHALHQLIKEIKIEASEENLQLLKDIHDLIKSGSLSMDDFFFEDNWNLSRRQCRHLVDLFKNNQMQELQCACEYFKEGCEPMKVFRESELYMVKGQNSRFLKDQYFEKAEMDEEVYYESFSP